MLIEQHYGSWKGKLDAQPVPAEPKQNRSKRADIKWDKPTLPRLWIAWHSPAADDVRQAALQNLLNEGYAEVRGFPALGIQGLVGLRASF